MNSDRDETDAERYDRNWSDLVQELRVAQTGVQVPAGLLLMAWVVLPLMLLRRGTTRP